jgi:protein TonB
MRRATSAVGSAPLSGADRELRLLEYAIAASIALHVLAFTLLQRATPELEPSPAMPEQISARLVERVPSAPPVAPSVVPLPVPPVVAVDPAPRPIVPPEPQPATEDEARQTPKPAAEARTAPAPERPAPAKVTPRPKTVAKPAPRVARKPAADGSKTPPAPREVQAPQPPPPDVARAAPSTSPAPSAPSVDEDVLARYRLELIAVARRYKRYPRAAMDNQWEGAAEVAMVIGANGMIRDMTISQSSGHALLDRQAIDMFRKAKPLVPIPEALRGREFRVTLKAIYSLRDRGA